MGASDGEVLSAAEGASGLPHPPAPPPACGLPRPLPSPRHSHSPGVDGNSSGLHICTSSTRFGNSCLFCSTVTNTSITSGPKSA
ncbi:unnamed protein product [Rangifer tarandus platyrhynchus]|uniref:Uncharacterized protein n=1 Tax=Rangifer tarandus platyrhynchus TaxID=3082113 RepID=A0AC59YG22_RANTA